MRSAGMVKYCIPNFLSASVVVFEKNGETITILYNNIYYWACDRVLPFNSQLEPSRTLVKTGPTHLTVSFSNLEITSE